MNKVCDNKSRPAWIEENLPAELATSTLFKFIVSLQVIEGYDADSGKPIYKKLEVDMLPDLDLDYDLLEQQMQQIPAQYAFWATIYSEVRLGVAIAERKLKARKAELTRLIKKELADEGVSVSADHLRTLIDGDERLNKAEMNLQVAQMQAGKLYHMLEALKMKAELARSLGSFKRQERDRN